jgi:small multidrug resistance pump
MEWVYLVAAIPSEVGATLALRAAATGRKPWYAVVAAGYLAAFALLSLALSEGMPLGVAYGIWAAAGVALTAIASTFLFREPLTLLMGAGIALIIGGILLIEVGGAR